MNNFNRMPLEVEFMSQDDVITGLNLTEIKKAQSKLKKANKHSLTISLELASHVPSAVEWFKSDEGKAKFAEEGISWSMDDFAQKMFGRSSGYMHKLRRCAVLDERVVVKFNELCDGDTSQSRSIDNLESYAKKLGLVDENTTDEELECYANAVELEMESAEEEAESKPKAKVTFSMQSEDGNLAMRINADGTIVFKESDKDRLRAAFGALHDIFSADIPSSMTANISNN
tara:strand:+ start:306 stop:995 length:690 start_codon:yes stop_codon:yes gene_type:complete